MNNVCNTLIAMNLSSFAFNLFSVLSADLTDDKSNILISPYSIASALSLVLAGATDGSQCQQELQSVLNVNSHEDIAELTKNLTNTSVLTSANGIWSRNLNESYIATVKDKHDAEANAMPDTYAPIDAYITEKTNGLITKMLEGPIDPLTVAVLVNAVHFKSDWTIKFDENLTVPGTFTALNGKEEQAMFMRAKHQMNVAENVGLLNGASIVQLDYGPVAVDVRGMQTEDAEFASFFILPSQKGNDGINDVTESLAALSSTGTGEQPFDKVLENMRNAKVDLSLPRFKMSYGVSSMVNALKAVGINECFNDGTLAKMSDDPNVHLDEFLHKAVVEVTEEGTEAAAASVGIVMTRAMPRPPIVLSFDRSFIMLIMHMPSKTPLFVGRMDNPVLMF